MLLALKGKLIHTQADTQAASKYSDLIDALVNMGYDKRAATAAIAEAVALAEKELSPNGTPGWSSGEKEKLLFKNAIAYLTGGALGALGGGRQ
jgi:hypothetical protein